MSETEYRVTYGGSERIRPIEELWTTARAARQCATERALEGHHDVRIWRREVPAWRPVDQSFMQTLNEGHRNG